MKRTNDRVNKLVERAVVELNASDMAAAETTCREIFALEPKNVNALRVMGAVMRDRNQLDEALEFCKEAVRHADRIAVLHFELGVTYFALNRSREAYESYLKAIELDPNLYAAYLNVSAIMEQQERFSEARDWALKTLKIKPDYALAHYNLANAYREMGSIDDAIKHYELAHKYRPEHPKTKWNLGICHLLLGHYREGWSLFECRQEAEEVMLDRYPQPRWDGSTLTGRTIVVHAEQGIGDEILFASCFPDMIARARGGRCVLVCDPRLQSLFVRSFPEAKVYAHARLSDWSPAELPEKIDVQIPAGSLPLHFRGSREAFPRRKRFLVVEPKLEAMWRERLAALGGELKVGISWRAGGKPTERRKRSIALEQWAEILTVPGVRFINLQYGDALADLAAARDHFGIQIHDWEEGDPLVDVDSYVAKISALDLVISVGNATVHMAGAVGTPAWTMLPTLPSWRWMAHGEVSPWYCGVRLFRQTERGEWSAVLDRIGGLLQRAAAAGDATLIAGEVSAPAAEMRHLEERTPTAARRAKPQAVGGAMEQASANEEAANEERWFGETELVGHEILDVVDRLIREGRMAEELDQLDKAETAYREVLQLAPRHVKALCGLGIVARKTHRSDLAIRCFQRALAVAEPAADQHLHLADALLDAGRIDEAVSGYQRALDLNPSHLGAQLQMGRVLRQAGLPEEAATHLRQVLAFDPQNCEALVELGQTLAATCRVDEAVDCFRQSLRLEPNSLAALEAMGIAYLDDQCFADAEECFRKGILAAPGKAESYFHLARALEAQSRPRDAAAVLEQALALNPAADGPLMRLAMVRRELGDFEAAAQLMERALQSKPADANLWNLLGVVERERGQSVDAIRSFDRALELQPDHAEAHFNRGLALLESNRLTAGWAEYEWRGGKGANAARQNMFSLPRWCGDSLLGRTILVHGEQSLADEVMFATCYEDVIARAADCLVVCDPRLERLFRRSFPAAQVMPLVRGGEAQWRLPAGVRPNLQIAAGSLPLYLRSTSTSFPRPHHILTADAARVAQWKKRYATTGDGLKVGLAWAGGTMSTEPRPRQSLDGRKSGNAGSNSALWRSLVEWSGALANRVQWINLQDDPGARTERTTLEAHLDVAIHDWPAQKGQYDVDDLAARIAPLDLVISFGGLPAHLAGALGVPAWAVIRPEDRWQWLASGETTLWYPSVRIFVDSPKTGEMSEPAETAGPLACLREELLKRLESPTEEKRMRVPSRPHWKLPVFEQDATANP